MRTYDDLVLLSQICAQEARRTEDREVAAKLRNIARAYQRQANTLLYFEKGSTRRHPTLEGERSTQH